MHDRKLADATETVHQAEPAAAIWDARARPPPEPCPVAPQPAAEVDLLARAGDCLPPAAGPISAPDHGVKADLGVVPEAEPIAAKPAPQSPGPVSAAPWRWRHVLRRTARVGAMVLAGWLATVVVAIALFRFVDPPGSMLMLLQRLGGVTVTHRWANLERISNDFVRTVIVSEDARFCRHWGIDFDEISNAIARAKDGTPRGASTITMQVAKNLFLWPSKSYVRKALEAPITLAIEALWPKRRIIEVYLNIAEWGPGVFGAEAAARHHFAKPASRIGAHEAALLAVALPSPVRRNAGKPGRLTERLAHRVEQRARATSGTTACLDL